MNNHNSNLSTEILNTIGKPVFFIDSNHKFIFVNNTFSNLYNKAPDEIIGKRIDEFFKEDTIEAIITQSIDKCLVDKSINFEEIVFGLEETIFNVEFYPHTNQNNEIDGVIAFADEIKIDENEDSVNDKFWLMAQNSRDLVYRMLLPDGVYDYVSPSCEKIIGYTQDELYDNPLLISEIIHTDFKEYFETEFQKLLNGKISESYEYKIIDKEGKERWVSQRNVLVKDIEGKPVAIEGSVREITRRKEMEIALAETNAKKDKFFSIISHDLRSPFNSILGFTNILLKTHKNIDDDKRQGIIENLYDTSRKAYDLLDNLLSWSKSQIGLLKYNPEKFNLRDIANEVIFFVEDSANSKKIKLENKIPAEIEVYADSILTETIIRNLFANAIKFTPEGGNITIKLSDNKIDNFVTISVIDNGIGISHDIVNDIFKVDSHAIKLGTNLEEGSGLGLLICKEFVTMQGGDIWVQSNEGEGSNFSFTIPKA